VALCRFTQHCSRSDNDVILLWISLAWKPFSYDKGFDDVSMGSWCGRNKIDCSLFANPSWTGRVAFSSHSIVVLGQDKYGGFGGICSSRALSRGHTL